MLDAKGRAEYFLGVAIDPTCIKMGRLERTELNLIHFKWRSRVNRHPLFFCLQFRARWIFSLGQKGCCY